MSYLQQLEEAYKANADSKRAIDMARYMKNRFEFFGIPSPLRKSIEREFVKKEGKPTLNELPAIIQLAYQKPQREFQYFINELTEKYVKEFPQDFIETAQFMIVTKSWWDTVDAIAADIAGTLVLNYPVLVKRMDEWIESDNMWLQRTAILHQLRYKKQTDEKRLFDYCLKHASQKEFFIRKAIGWALREYSKTNPVAVKKFVNETPLTNFSKNEALKWMNRKKQ